ncbi:hypothetical protein SNEBB_006538 [Seison nebaliae]|nr:hypothetical protein SNEBB_006538 [Seison nebaliae]
MTNETGNCSLNQMQWLIATNDSSSHNQNNNIHPNVTNIQPQKYTDKNNADLQPKNQYQKPQASYATLIEMALNSVPSKKMVVAKIYDWFRKNFPYYQNCTDNWQNGIRYTLSTNATFERVQREPRSGRGDFWTFKWNVPAPPTINENKNHPIQSTILEVPPNCEEVCEMSQPMNHDHEMEETPTSDDSQCTFVTENLERNDFDPSLISTSSYLGNSMNDFDRLNNSNNFFNIYENNSGMDTSDFYSPKHNEFDLSFSNNGFGIDDNTRRFYDMEFGDTFHNGTN